MFCVKKPNEAPDRAPNIGKHASRVAIFAADRESRCGRARPHGGFPPHRSASAADPLGGPGGAVGVPLLRGGCGQHVYVRDGKILDIEGDPDSPISRGCLCPKGAATFQLVTGSHRVRQVLYRRPYGTNWETMPLEQAMEMVAERVKKTREATWEAKTPDGHTVTAPWASPIWAAPPSTTKRIT